MTKTKVLYVTYEAKSSHSFYVSNSSTDWALRHAFPGSSTIYVPENTHFFAKFAKLFLSVQKYKPTALLIAADGRMKLELLTCIKIFFPHMRIYWELHAPHTEPLWFGDSAENRYKALKGRIIRRSMAPFLHGTICMTPALAFYSRTFLSQKNTWVIPSHYEAKLFQPQPIRLRNQPTRFTVFWGGNMMFPWHNTALLLSVAHRILKVNPRITFTLVGEHPKRMRVPPNVHLVGPVSHNAYVSLLQSSDLCIALFSEKSEHYTGLPFYFSPRKIIEYLWFQKPIIASRNDVTTRILGNGSAGILAENSATRIAQYIQELYKNTDKRQHYVREAKKQREHFYSTNGIKQYAKALSGNDRTLSKASNALSYTL